MFKNLLKEMLASSSIKILHNFHDLVVIEIPVYFGHWCPSLWWYYFFVLSEQSFLSLLSVPRDQKPINMGVYSIVLSPCYEYFVSGSIMDAFVLSIGNDTVPMKL